MEVLPTIELRKRPRLADWGEYAAAVYEVMGWGAEQFLEDWAQVVKKQLRGTLDGSPVAQTVIRFMEERNQYEGSSSELHVKLEQEAEKMSIDTKKDKSWPRSSSWLWRRMKEVLPLLTATGIQAHKHDAKTGTRIILERVGGPPDDDKPGGGEGWKQNDKGWKQNSGASTDASTKYPAEVSGPDPNKGNGGSSGSIYGPLWGARKKGGEQAEQPENEPEHTGLLELPGNASAASTASTGTKRPLTEDEVQQARRLISEGVSPAVARREVVGVEGRST
jgi:hypothetical protein